MCGVAGVWHHSGRSNQLDVAELEAVTMAMARRGPDGSGTWVGDEGRLGLGHRRLAIIGLGEQGHQPMELPQRCHGKGNADLVVSYNGEIYNFPELRCRLVDSGHDVRTSTDTEVLLHLYEDEGPTFVRHLRGMFAFALWDGERQELHLARDPFGIKPLYLSDNGSAVRVASQTQALRSSGRISLATSDAALAGFLILGSIPEPLTCWTAIESVEAGTVVTIGRSGSRSVHRYYDLADVLANAGPPDARPFSEIVEETVSAHLVADVEVGLFLSGGIDSNVILGVASAQKQEVRAVTLGFSEFAGTPDDETPLAAEGAKLYGAQHTIHWLSRSDVLAAVPSVLEDMDQPSVDGLNTWLVARATAEAGFKVALSGVGGDEFLGGYSTFQRVPQLVGTMRRVTALARIGPGVRRLSRPVLARKSPKMPGLLEYGNSIPRAWLLQRAIFMPWELGSILGADRAREALHSLNLDLRVEQATGAASQADNSAVAALEAGLYMRNQLLRDADWAGMAHSLEIRVPLADSGFVQGVGARLPQWHYREGKEALAAIPSPSLPHSVVYREKTGFSVPMGAWVLDERPFLAWRRSAPLRRGNASWSRRWAYVVADRFGILS